MQLPSHRFLVQRPRKRAGRAQSIHRHARWRHCHDRRALYPVSQPRNASDSGSDASCERAVAGRLTLCHGRCGAPARRSRRQIRSTATADLAARRHGWSHSHQRIDPCGDHGDGRRLSDRAHPRALFAGAGRSVCGCDCWSGDARGCGLQRSHAVRHQTYPGLFHGEPDRIYVPRARRRLLGSGHVPLHDPRLFQGSSLPCVRRRH